MNEANYIGEYDCKLDEKGRLRLPNQLIRQLEGRGTYSFVIMRGFEGCLLLFEEERWKEHMAQLQKLSMYRSKDRMFIRLLMSSASKLSLDSADRIMLTKKQRELAGMTKEVVISSAVNGFEIWDKKKYAALLSEEMGSFSELADEFYERTIAENRSDNDAS